MSKTEDLEIIADGRARDPDKFTFYLPTRQNVQALNAEGHPLAFQLMLDQHFTTAYDYLNGVGFDPVLPEITAESIRDQRPILESVASQARFFVDAAGDHPTAEMQSAAAVLEHVAFLYALRYAAPDGKLSGALALVSPDGKLAGALALAALVGSSMGFAVAHLEGADRITQIAPQSLAHVDVVTRGGLNSASEKRWWHQEAYPRAKYLCGAGGKTVPSAAKILIEELTKNFPDRALDAKPPHRHPIPSWSAVKTVLERWQRLQWPDQIPPPPRRVRAGSSARARAVVLTRKSDKV